MASTWDVSALDGTNRRDSAGWSYPNSTQPFSFLAGWISIYSQRVDGCMLDGEPMTAQPGALYGGWISPWIQGLLKGDPNHPEPI